MDEKGRKIKKFSSNAEVYVLELGGKKKLSADVIWGKKYEKGDKKCKHW